MIIALTGQRKSGKSLLSKMLRDLHPNFRRIAFGDAMKDRLAEKFNIPIFDLYSPLGKEKYRHLMQVFAEEQKTKDPAIWVNIVTQIIDAQSGDYVIDDLRFLIELEALIKRKALIVQVVADRLAQIERGALSAGLNPVLNKAISEHISENDVATLPGEVIQSLGGVVIYNNLPKVYKGDRMSDNEYAIQTANAKQDAEVHLRNQARALLNQFQNRLANPLILH
jgi:dephospho-CoA kinase